MGEKGGDSRRDLEGLPSFPLQHKHLTPGLALRSPRCGCNSFLPWSFHHGSHVRPPLTTITLGTKGMVPQRLGSTVGFFCFGFLCF